MTIRAIRSEVCGLRSPRPTPSSHHGSEALVARRSWTTSTNAQAHMYDAVMLCGRGGCHPPRPSSSLQPLPRGSPRTTNGSPKAQLSTCIADADRARLDGNPPAQPEGKSGHYQKNPIAAPRSLAPATAPNSPSDWPRPISDEAIPTLGGAARVGDSKPPPPWVQTSETRASKKDPSSPFFLSATFPLWAHTCATVAQAGRDDWPLSLCPGPSFGRLSCFLKHSSLTAHRSEAARGWGLVKPGKKASPRWIWHVLDIL